MVCSSTYCVGQGEELQDKVATGNVGSSANTQKEERLAGTSTKNVVRKSFQATRNINRQEDMIQEDQEEDGFMSEVVVVVVVA
jgi:hypothetical protein